MTKKLLISEEEKERILNLHKNAIVENLIKQNLEESYSSVLLKAQSILKNKYKKFLGSSGKNKDGVDGLYGPNTKKALESFQEDMDIPVTGILDDKTKAALGIQGESQKTEQPKKEESSQNCTAIEQSICTKISSTSEKGIGSGSGEGCSEYVRKMTGHRLGNAWQAFVSAKSKGSVIYNMFTDGSINWKSVFGNPNFANSSICGCFVEEGEGKDSSCKDGKNLSSKISSLYPSNSSINISSLKVGDIVGMYYRDSGNKGKAFCERAVQNRGLDKNGKFSDMSPFTFNTHVGYVGAIKNGVPIVFHSVHGTRLATPATKLLSKNGEAMITWAVGMGLKTQETPKKDSEDEVKWYDPSSWFE
jgi:hypothetical protein